VRELFREADRPADLVPMEQGERVTREGHDVPLAKLSFDLLATLIRNAPDLVSVESLMQQVWPGLVVGPETVSQRIDCRPAVCGHEPA
jgi:DNA-binding winged helix-turn-helix (wHTH) protein